MRRFAAALDRNVEFKKSSQTKIKLPRNVIINQIFVIVEVPYAVVATPPTDLMAGGAYNVIERLQIEDNTPKGRYWDINALSIYQNCRWLKDVLIDAPAFTTGAGTDDTLYIPFVIDFTNRNSPVSVYDTGLNTYTKEAFLTIDWADFNSDGVVFAHVEGFAITDANVKVHYFFNMHTVDDNHEARKQPHTIPMRCLKTAEKRYDQTGELTYELEPGRNYLHLHLAAVKTVSADSQTVLSDDLFDDFTEIALVTNAGANDQKLRSSSWEMLKYETMQALKLESSEIAAGLRTLPIIDDNRIVQNLVLSRQGDVLLKCEEAKTVVNHTVHLEICQEYLVSQDVAPGQAAI